MKKIDLSENNVNKIFLGVVLLMMSTMIASLVVSTYSWGGDFPIAVISMAFTLPGVIALLSVRTFKVQVISFSIGIIANTVLLIGSYFYYS